MVALAAAPAAALAAVVLYAADSCPSARGPYGTAAAGSPAGVGGAGTETVAQAAPSLGICCNQTSGDGSSGIYAPAAPVAEVSLRTPEGTKNILQLLGKARLNRSGLWQRVRLAVLPNGTTGWVPRSARGSPVLRDSRLVINRRRFRATLFRNGMRVFGAPIGVGQGRWPTPAGSFYARDTMIRYRSAAYGPIAFGTGARSATRTDWPAGGYIGIRGTDQASLIPGPISHGCIRMRKRGHRQAREANARRRTDSGPMRTRRRRSVRAIPVGGTAPGPLAAAALTGVPAAVGATGTNEQVPTQLIQQFPLNRQTTQTANRQTTSAPAPTATAKSQAPASSATATRSREDADGGFPFVWLLVLAAGALDALGLWLVRLSPSSLARALHSPPRPAPASLGAAFTGPVPRLQPVLLDGGPGPP